MATLNEFLLSPQRNAWVELDQPISLYVRKAKRVIEGNQVDTFDLATVEVEESQRGQGMFKSLLEKVELLAKDHGFDGVFVESIQEPKLLDFLLRRGYQYTSPPDSLCPNVYKACPGVVHRPEKVQRLE